MDTDTVRLKWQECLDDLGRSFTAKTPREDGRLNWAESALIESKDILKLAEGLVELCSARVCMLGGTPKIDEESNPE